MKSILLTLFLSVFALNLNPCSAGSMINSAHSQEIRPQIDLILVIKSEKRLYLMSGGQVYRSYWIALGANPEGHKQQEGDEKTPEGVYQIDYKNENSGYFHSFHITYPNRKDRENAKKLGVSPGGNIMIHGFKNGHEWFAPLYHYIYNWTDGCIAISNSAMTEMWELVEAGTPVQIRP